MTERSKAKANANADVDSPRPMRRAFLVTHGNVGREMVHACEKILGAQPGVETFSNDDTSIEGLTRLLRERLPDEQGTVFLFTDLLGGSCSHACREVQRSTPGVHVFTGINLPMLLEFFHYRDRTTDEELVQRLLSRARDGIQVL